MLNETALLFDFDVEAQRRAPAADPTSDQEVLADIAGDAVTAKRLLRQLGSLQRVLGAEVSVLMALGASPGAARSIRASAIAAQKMAHGQIARRPVISSWSAVLAYVRAAMAYQMTEGFRVLFLDRKNQLILDEVMGKGTVDHAPVYPREIATRALLLGASAVILVHNHPSGDPSPSGADIDMTRQVIDALRPLRISVHDHLVVGSEGVASFKALGLM